MMLVAVIANRAQVIVRTLAALPSNTEDWLLATGITHCAFVLDAGRCTVQHAQVIRTGAAIVGRRAIVPNDDHLFGRFKIAHSAHMPFTAVLLGFDVEGFFVFPTQPHTQETNINDLKWKLVGRQVDIKCMNGISIDIILCSH